MPASGDAPISARIDEIFPRGEFATWRAARAVGDYDLNTFLIRADLVGDGDMLQPGMSVWLKPSATDAAVGQAIRNGNEIWRRWKSL